MWLYPRSPVLAVPFEPLVPLYGLDLSSLAAPRVGTGAPWLHVYT